MSNQHDSSKSPRWAKCSAVASHTFRAVVPWAFACAFACAMIVSPVASSQEVDQPSDGPAEVIPIRVLYPEQAYILQPGQLQLETDYAANFISGSAPNLHLFDILAAMAVADMVEVRMGWDYLGIAGDHVGIGDLLLGVKGGFFGGLTERTALAGFVNIQLPTGNNHIGLGSGIRLFGGFVATHLFGPVQLDFQLAVDTHIFVEDYTFYLPISVGMRWAPIDPLQVYADFLVSLDFTDFSETQSSLLAGVGYRFIPQLEVFATSRVGLSPSVPDVVLQVGVAWLVWDFW